MASLGSWNRIDNVLTGLPFGSGSAGSATVSSDGNTRATATGTINTTSLTIGSAILSNGDIFLIHQTQGTGAGQYEFNRVASGGGTTSITTLKPLKYGYVSGAQVVLFSQYMTATVSGYTGTAWNGSTGGIGVICARNSITISGAVSWNGKGFAGGASVGSGTKGRQGESSTAAGGTQSTSANGMGGGGGDFTSTNQRQGGGGGGHSSSGSNGGQISGGTAGTGGSTGGSADGTTVVFGGAGGSGSGEGGTSGGTAGGNSGGILFLISKSITMSAVASANGDNGVTNTDAGAGGGGAGGSIIGVCQTASLGTNNLTATGGTGGNGNSTADGGNGSTGRIAIHHSSTVTGTTNPTFNDTSDTTITEKLYGASILF